MTLKPINLSANLGPTILGHLRKMADLPYWGFVAGQSVASAILEIFGGEFGQIYNDIDVFYQPIEQDTQGILWQLDKVQELANSRKKTTTVVHKSWALDCDSYGHIHLSKVERYKVLGSWRSGLVNLVACQFMNEVFFNQNCIKQPCGGGSQALQSLIKSFDFNCVQVGVDLATGVLQWTPEFEEFVRTRQLEIVRLHTPYHTAIRWFKKKAELPEIFADSGKAMQLITWADAKYRENVERGRAGVWVDSRWQFGNKVKELYQKHEEAIKPYFSLVKHGSLYILKPNLSCDTEFEKSMVPFEYDCEFASSAAKIMLTKKKSIRDKLTQIGYDQSNRDMFQATKPARVAFSLQGIDFFEHQKTKSEELAQTLKFIHKTHNIAFWFVNYKADDLVAAVKNIKSVAKARGDWVYGVLETHADGCIDMLDLYSINAFLDKLELELSAPLKEKTCADLKTINGIHISELVTSKDLLTEGEEMHHCVGGYADSVSQFRSFIFSIRSKSFRSTVEISQYKNNIHLAQHTSSFNRDICLIHFLLGLLVFGLVKANCIGNTRATWYSVRVWRYAFMELFRLVGKTVQRKLRDFIWHPLLSWTHKSFYIKLGIKVGLLKSPKYDSTICSSQYTDLLEDIPF